MPACRYRNIQSTNMKNALLRILLILFLPLSGFAQTYQAKGKILDATTGTPLSGANIIIKDTNLGNITDDKGQFLIDGIRSRSITLMATFVGYETAELTLQINPVKPEEITIRLQPLSLDLEQVEVEAKAIGQVKALLDQKRSANIKNIVSAEQLATFPDLNAAEAMQRIPGITLQRDQGEGRFVQLRGTPPELTNFNINGEQVPSPEGNVRYVGMDIISVDQIAFIEVTKVLTPDMDADGIAGTVNIITKKAEEEKPEIKATLSGGYNNLRQVGNYQAQFSYGQRYGKFGFNINSNYYLNNQGADNMEYKFAKGPFFGSQDQGKDNFFVQYREFQLRHYDITRTRIGVSPTLDFQFGPKSNIYLMGIYNSFNDDEVRRRLIYDLDDALSETYYLFGGVEHDVRARLKKQNLSTINFGGEHELFGLTLNYQIAYALAKEDEPDRLEALFDSPGQAIAISFDRTDPDYPRATFPNEAQAANVYAYNRYEMDELSFQKIQISDRNITPRINLKIPYASRPGSNGYLQFGGKARLKRKERDIQAQVFGAYFEQTAIYPDIGPELNLLTVDDGFQTNNLLNKGYVLEKMPSPEKLRDFYEFYPHHFIFDRTATKVQSYGEDYTANERILAGYGMFRHDFEKLMILGGLRYENTNVDYQGIRIVTKNGRFQELDTLHDERNHAFLLPQFQMKYAFTDRFNVRAALTYTYSRPNFEDVLPYRQEDRQEVKFGNPDLIYPSSTNIDFLAEKYLRGNGIISGGLFYKNIQDFIFFYKRFAHEGDPKDYGLVEITKAVNGNKAFVYGAELQTQFKMDFLPGLLKYFGWYLNYTYTYSEAFINKRLPANYSNAIVVFGEDDLSVFSSSESQEKIVLPGQAQHTTNLALFFESPKLYARIIANYNDDFLYRLGADEDLDEYTASAWRLDFTANYKVTRNLRLFTDMINITNAPLKFYLGTKDRIRQQEFYSWWARGGIKLTF